MHSPVWWWEWLVANGLLKDILAAFVSGTIVTCIATAVAWNPWVRHKKEMLDIEDKLNTQTEGGLGDVVARLEAIESTLGARDPGPQSRID